MLTFKLQLEARLPTQSLKMMRTVISPKLESVQNWDHVDFLHPTTSSLLFSSVSSLAGLSAHANYAAANAALDAFAEHQANIGLVATAVQWGAWASVGVYPQVSTICVAAYELHPPYRCV
jgi:hypothetical protein